jgi:rifampicin phosphotransferase
MGADDLPAGALVGLAVSAGIVEGRARVTRLIRDGQRIRGHGTDGYVEILPWPGQSDR